MGMPNPLERVLINEDLDWKLNSEVEEILTFFYSQHGPRSSSFERLEWGNGLKPKPSIEEPLVLDLKPLPYNLKCSFLNPTSFIQVMIFVGLHEIEEEKLLWVLKDNKEAFGWKIHDIKGLDPIIFNHKINIKAHKQLPQKRLNLNKMEVVKGEVIKLLDA